MTVTTVVTGSITGVLALFTLAGCNPAPATPDQSMSSEARPVREVPVFEYDETFPKPLPNHWAIGTVVGISVDPQ